MAEANYTAVTAQAVKATGKSKRSWAMTPRGIGDTMPRHDDALFRKTEMDASPYFDPETNSVRFQVLVHGKPVKASVTREWLVTRYGHHIPADARMVDTYLEHAAEIDHEIARRFSAGRVEPVWLASSLPPLV